MPPALVFLTFIVLSFPAQAQLIPDTLKSDSITKINTLEEVEVQANYSTIVTRRFPATVYTTKGGSDNILLPVNINESFNKVPSIYAHTGTFNTSRITMRGIGTRSLYGTRKINALLNDIPLTSGEGDTFIDDLDLQLIDKIEILGGPTSGIYGPALGGTILLSVTPSTNKNSLFVNSGMGSFGTFQNAISINGSRSSSSLLMTYKNVHSDGYRANNNYNRNSALVNYSIWGKRPVWNILLLYTNVDAEIPSSIDSLTFETNPRAAAATWAKTNGREASHRLLAGVNNHYKFSSAFSSFVTLYGLYKKSEEVRPFDMLHEDDRAGGIKFYFKKSFEKIEGLTITPGFSSFFERYRPSLFENIDGIGMEGSKTAENREYIFQTNAFVIADYMPDLKNFVSASLNINRNSVSDQNVFASAAKQTYKKGLYLSPRVSFSRQLIPNHFVFASISHGISYPSIQEILYPDGTINNDVKPEHAWSFETGVKGIQLFGEVKYAVSFYYMPVVDLIVPDRIAEDTYIGKNIGKSLHRGVEVSIEKAVPEINPASWLYIGDYHLSASWQSNRFTKFYQDSLNLKGNDLPGVPGKKLFFSVLFRVKKSFYIEPELYLNDETAMNDENNRYYSGYGLFNLRFGLKHEVNKFQLKLSAAINNVFDKSYASMILINAPATGGRPPRYYYPGNPRNYFVSLSISYNL